MTTLETRANAFTDECVRECEGQLFVNARDHSISACMRGALFIPVLESDLNQPPKRVIFRTYTEVEAAGGLDNVLEAMQTYNPRTEFVIVVAVERSKDIVYVPTLVRPDLLRVPSVVDPKTGLNEPTLQWCSAPTCWNTTRAHTLSRCAQCKQVRYCSKECQRSDWAVHKFECPYMKAEAAQSACTHHVVVDGKPCCH